MKLKTPQLSPRAALLIIEEARNAETCRDIKSLQEILRNVWTDIETDPDFENFEPAIKAEFLRLSGSFLTLYASAKGLKNFHLRAKDLLSRSIGLYESLGLPEKVAEANIWLGFAYGNCGEVEEYNDIYNMLELQFGEHISHPISLLIDINRLAVFICNRKFKIAEKYIQERIVSFDNSPDLRLKALFHGNAAIVFRNLKKLDLSSFHFNEAIRFSSGLKMYRFEGRNYNNLALLYKEQSDFDNAHLFADKALKTFIELGDTGTIAGVLDTKALIFIAEKRYFEALETIDTALEYFYQGEDFHSLTEALWTRCLCLFRLRRKHEALITYGDLYRIAEEKIGRSALQKFENLLDEEIFILQGLSLDEEKENLEIFLLRRALIKTGGRIGKAAEILGLPDYRNLQYKLKNKYSFLKAELKIKERKSPKSNHNPKKLSKQDTEFKVVELLPSEIKSEKISRMLLPKVLCAFNFDFPADEFETFLFPEHWMRQFGINQDAIVAVSPLIELADQKLVLLLRDGEFLFGKLEKDIFAGSGFYFNCGDAIGPVPLSEIEIIGEPVGFYDGRTESKFVEFQRFEI